jgi:hypothetical protein
MVAAAQSVNSYIDNLNWCWLAQLRSDALPNRLRHLLKEFFDLSECGFGLFIGLNLLLRKPLISLDIQTTRSPLLNRLLLTNVANDIAGQCRDLTSGFVDVRAHERFAPANDRLKRVERLQDLLLAITDTPRVAQRRSQLTHRTARLEELIPQLDIELVLLLQPQTVIECRVLRYPSRNRRQDCAYNQTNHRNDHGHICRCVASIGQQHHFVPSIAHKFRWARVAPHCTEEADERNENGDSRNAVNPNVARTFRTERGRSASRCTDRKGGRMKVSPTGLAGNGKNRRNVLKPNGFSAIRQPSSLCPYCVRKSSTAPFVL